MSSQELFGDPNTYSQGIWKTRVRFDQLAQNIPQISIKFQTHIRHYVGCHAATWKPSYLNWNLPEISLLGSHPNVLNLNDLVVEIG